MNIISALTIATVAASIGSVSATSFASNDSLSFERIKNNVGQQQAILLEEKKALDEAIKTKNNQVHITNSTLAAISSGVTSYVFGKRFYTKTNNFSDLRNLFTKNANGVTVLKADGQVIGSVGAAEKVGAGTTFLENTKTVALRTLDLSGAVIFGVLFAEQSYQMADGLYIVFRDNDQIRDLRAQVKDATYNLAEAEKNLYVAVNGNN